MQQIEGDGWREVGGKQSHAEIFILNILQAHTCIISF